jgi:hypothetical protein
VTRIFSVTQEAAIPSTLLQNLDFCTKLDVYWGTKKTHAQKKKHSAKFSKKSHRNRRGRSTWTKSNWSMFQRNPRTKNACKKNLVSRETHLKKTPKKLFKKKRKQKKNLGNLEITK